MKIYFLILAFCISDTKIFAQSHDVVWAKDIITKDVTPTQIIADSKGNILICGQFRDSIAIDDSVMYASDTFDGFVYKIDSNGKVLWQKQLGAHYGNIRSIAVDEYDNLIIAGSFQNGGANFYGLELSLSPDSESVCNGLIMKLNENGNYLWHIQISGYSTFPEKITTDFENNIIVAGQLGDNIIFDTMPDSISFGGQYTLTSLFFPYVTCKFISKISPLGELLWAGEVNDMTSGTTLRSIETDNFGNIFLLSNFSFEINILGDEIVVPSFYFCIAKIDTEGNLTELFIPDTASGNLYSVQLSIDEINSLVCSGYVGLPGDKLIINDSLAALGESEFFIRFDSNCEYISTSLTIDSNHEFAQNNKLENGIFISQGFANQIIINGEEINQIGNGLHDLIAFKIDTTGSLIWYDQFLSSLSSFIFSQTLSDNNLYLLGIFIDTLILDTITLISPFSLSDYHGFIVKIRDNTMPTIIEQSDPTLKNSDISIFPNPATENCTMELNNAKNCVASIQIIDINGKIVHSFSMQTNIPLTFSINHFSAGVYIARCILPDETNTISFVKQ